MTASLVVLGVCFVFALFLIAVGVVRVVQIGLALKARVTAYASLPIFELARLEQARVARASDALGTVSSLVDRMRLGVARIVDARASLASSLRTAGFIVRSWPQVLFDL